MVLNSSTLEKDAACSFGCIQLSVVLFIGSLLFELWPSLWWVDSVTTIFICVLILKEAVETLHAVASADFKGCACASPQVIFNSSIVGDDAVIVVETCTCD